jgi:folylpolyglutamate synthase/dihydropteroate synthase
MREAGVEASQIIENESVVAALAKARENASINDKIIVFGSFVTVTDVLPLL